MHSATEEWPMDADRFDTLSRRLGAHPARRALLSAGVGLVLMACGWMVPVKLQEAAAREGTYGGDLGGRHGRNRRGRDQQREHADDQRHTKQNTTTAPPPPACAASCPSQCALCV